MSSYSELKQILKDGFEKIRDHFDVKKPAPGKNSELISNRVNKILTTENLQDPLSIVKELDDWLKNKKFDGLNWLYKNTEHSAIAEIETLVEQIAEDKRYGLSDNKGIDFAKIKTLKEKHEQEIKERSTLEAEAIANADAEKARKKKVLEDERQRQLNEMQRKMDEFQSALQKSTTKQEEVQSQVVTLREELTATTLKNQVLESQNLQFSDALKIVGKTIIQHGNKELWEILQRQFKRKGFENLLMGSEGVLPTDDDHRFDDDADMASDDDTSTKSSRKRNLHDDDTQLDDDGAPHSKKRKSSSEKWKSNSAGYPGKFYVTQEERTLEVKAAETALNNLKLYLLPHIVGNKMDGVNRIAVPITDNNTDFALRYGLVEKLMNVGLRPNIASQEKAIVKLYIFIMLRCKYTLSMKQVDAEVSGFLNRTYGIDVPNTITDLFAPSNLSEDDFAIINSVKTDLEAVSEKLKQKNIESRIQGELSPEEANSFALVYATSAKVAFLNDAYAKSEFEQLDKKLTTLTTKETHSIPPVTTLCRRWANEHYTDLKIAVGLMKTK